MIRIFAFRIAMAALAAFSPLLVAVPDVYAAQHDAQSQTDVSPSMTEAARTRLTGSGPLADKVARAQARSEIMQTMMRERAASFASKAVDESAAQLRASLPGNARVAQSEAAPCNDPAPDQAADGPVLCKPGEH